MRIFKINNYNKILKSFPRKLKKNLFPFKKYIRNPLINYNKKIIKL